ncbi:MAG: 4Fe-4S dicluster domain-containing protein [Magnetococcales bacterium]|nr:4Fe-4S dicluster domain-containing protein [Magnetococcales bacterium]MBF0321469.1 4Fe-4S dicluster domain-containing protein [Magnetococcales bacterium]
MTPLPENEGPVDGRRRRLLQGGVATGLAMAGSGSLLAMADADGAVSDTLGSFFQDHYLRMQPHEVVAALARIERRIQRDYGVKATCSATLPQPAVAFAFALNLSKCAGTRRCVEACVQENNCGRDGTLQNIRVLEMDAGQQDLSKGDPYYQPEKVPVPGRWYLPVQCQQCDDPPCVQACPVGATWKEPDGVVVIDYDWCIGCRYCAVSCPYWARHFNWGKPRLTGDEVTLQTHYLGNRPRMAGVMEKCTFCLQRTRQGGMPACQEACPTGARIFGNLLDPDSEIRYVLTHQQVFRLKEDLHTSPRFWYFADGP